MSRWPGPWSIGLPRSVFVGLPAAVCVALLAAGCGKKGAPLAPFSDLPRAVGDLTARRIGQQIVVRFTVPDVNIDNRGPANLERVDLYMSPTRLRRAADYVDRERLIDTVLVREPAPEGAADQTDGDAGEGGDPAGEAATARPGIGQGGEATIIFDVDVAAFADEPFEEAPPVVPVVERPVAPARERVVTLYPNGGGPLMSPPRVRTVYYVAVAVNRRGRQGPPSRVVDVPIFDPPPAPGVPEVVYTETDLTVTWAPPAMPRRPIQSADLAYTVLRSSPLPTPVRRPIQQPTPLGTNLPSRPLPRLPIRPIQSTTLEYKALPSRPWSTFVTATGYTLYEVDGPDPPRLVSGMPIPRPLNGTTLVVEQYETRPVVFGEQRCLIVRTREERGGVALESAPSPVTCVTPVDTFAPGAPQNLFLVASEGAISLIWDANTEADLAGYLVLRGDAPGETLQSLTSDPVSETTYRDATVTGGVAYVYAVVAVDAAGNRSLESRRVEERGR